MKDYHGWIAYRLGDDHSVRWICDLIIRSRGSISSLGLDSTLEKGEHRCQH